MTTFFHQRQREVLDESSTDAERDRGGGLIFHKVRARRAPEVAAREVVHELADVVVVLLGPHCLSRHKSGIQFESRFCP